MATPSENKTNKKCCGSCQVDPRDDPLDCVSIFALIVLACGIILVSVGYLIPRDHTIDPKLSARENERLGLQFAKLASDLDICIITGMVLVGVGGVTMAGLLIAVLCRGDLSGNPRSKSRPTYGARGTTESSSTRQLFQMSEVENGEAQQQR